jgi:hypothetical protein
MAESVKVDKMCEGPCGKMMYGVDKKRRICSVCRREKEKLSKRAQRVKK